eukprot:CAMPEP_0197445278 /NCGR_PEP_ID=MMETSP1175-20131217/10537_1 /TAXON_ID=1003142 /ORGANISM="Triceratium dubium, Strain CCMP147" /LENGTH=904 /DNA_ID=CAMNT_0042976211 /DNA_START=89 /DNA_END=2803 /DNA_ORIENTATION=+
MGGIKAFTKSKCRAPKDVVGIGTRGSSPPPTSSAKSIGVRCLTHRSRTVAPPSKSLGSATSSSLQDHARSVRDDIQKLLGDKGEGEGRGHLLLSESERSELSELYRDLRDLLPLTDRSGDYTARVGAGEASVAADTPREYADRFGNMENEFDEAEREVRRATSLPAAVRPLTKENLLENVGDFFVLDNTLRETTVGTSRGHTQKEKHEILDQIAKTGLEEIILGSFGSKISVDGQVCQRWDEMGKSFDNSWGFTDAYDLQPYDDGVLWETVPEFLDAMKDGDDLPDYYTPPAKVLEKYSEEDVALLHRAAAKFKHLKETELDKMLLGLESSQGRIPMGLIMMAGYGVSNAIIEVDMSVETFDYARYDVVEHVKRLIGCAKTLLPRRKNVSPGEDNTARIIINLRDFFNYKRSSNGLTSALKLVDELCRLPPSLRPFGFAMEEPTGYLFPEEVGKLVRMIRLTMDRAGHRSGRFLVHVHMYFGMAEANTLAALCNGADGVWAAVCTTGAQVGHACSTTTVVNLFRAGHGEMLTKFDLKGMTEAARKCTEITTHARCPPHTEVYGELAFDVPYFMTNLPSCRYAIGALCEAMQYERPVRINEICAPSSIYHAMVKNFGEPKEGGWDPSLCRDMFRATHDHLLTGLSRDYNTAVGLGLLYATVADEPFIPRHLLERMDESSPISDLHPVVVDFTQRWNRLAARLEGKDEPPLSGSKSRSALFYNEDIRLEPTNPSLRLIDVMSDTLKSPFYDNFPESIIAEVSEAFEEDIQVVQKQGEGGGHALAHYLDWKVRLKMFLQEADGSTFVSVDDFIMQRTTDVMFDQGAFWNKRRNEKLKKICFKAMRYRMEGVQSDPGYLFRNTAGIRAMKRNMEMIVGGMSSNKDSEAVRKSFSQLKKGFEVTSLTEL